MSDWRGFVGTRHIGTKYLLVSSNELKLRFVCVCVRVCLRVSFPHLIKFYCDEMIESLILDNFFHDGVQGFYVASFIRALA